MNFFLRIFFKNNAMDYRFFFKSLLGILHSYQTHDTRLVIPIKNNIFQ